MTKELNEKLFFIIKKEAWNWGTQYTIHDHKQYDLTTAVRKLLALDELNEDKKQISFHLQEVNFSMVDKPLRLTDEVKEESWKDQVQEDLPF